MQNRDEQFICEGCNWVGDKLKFRLVPVGKTDETREPVCPSCGSAHLVRLEDQVEKICVQTQTYLFQNGMPADEPDILRKAVTMQLEEKARRRRHQMTKSELIRRSQRKLFRVRR
jgi:hypothetical protein